MASGWKIYDGTNWLDPCNCNIHVLDSTNTWVLLDPKNCPVKYWNGCAWVPILCPCNCPEGYIQNPSTGECEQITLSPAVFTGSTANIIAGDKISQYGQFGARMYQDITLNTWPIIGFQSGGVYILRDNNGVGVSIPINATSTNSIFQSVNSATGRLNICGVWANPWPVTLNNPVLEDDWLKFEFCIDIPEEKQFVMAIAGDNQVRIQIDSAAFGGLVDIVTLKAATSASDVAINSFVTEPFDYWHMFPITLPAGSHRLILAGSDAGGNNTVGIEIYNRTRDEMIPLMAAGAVVSDLEPYILFSTKNLVQLPPLTIAASGATGTWSCSDALLTFSDCYGVPACVSIDITDCEYN
jgi:hypothetical protein